MQVWFNPSQAIETALQAVAVENAGFGPEFTAGVRPADPKFGDFQANGVLGYAKRIQANPRELAQKLIDAAQASKSFDPKLVELTLAGPGFINFKLTRDFLWQWLQEYSTKTHFQAGAAKIKQRRRIVIDYPSANTAKQGAYRPFAPHGHRLKRSPACSTFAVRKRLVTITSAIGAQISVRSSCRSSVKASHLIS
jgi:arginyl-tRNA synthetase